MHITPGVPWHNLKVLMMSFFSILGIFLLVDSQVSDLIQFKVEYFVVPGSSNEPNDVWCLDDFCCCIFALAAINNIIITDYACDFHPFNVGSWLWLLWQAVCGDTRW